MKKLIILACLLLTALTACTGKTGSKVEQTNGVDKVLKEMTGENQGATEVQESTEAETEEATAISGELQEATEINTEEAQESISAETEEATIINEAESTSADKGAVEGNSSKTVDVDLTLMDKDMVYATVYQLMTAPDDYVGKTIKIKGTYSLSWYEENQEYYHFVIIRDATACCAQGIEFIWGDGSHVYPDDYPSEGTEIEVTGNFETYEEDGYMYCRLADSVLELS